MESIINILVSIQKTGFLTQKMSLNACILLVFAASGLRTKTVILLCSQLGLAVNHHYDAAAFCMSITA